MGLMRSLKNGIRALMRRDDRNAEIAEELRSFEEQSIAEKMRRGMTRENAERAVRRETGSAESVRHKVWSAGWESVAEVFWQDVRYGVRQLLRSPGFALTAILSLALGIGATTAVFSVIYGVLLHPFPYVDVDRLANLSVRDRSGQIFDDWFLGPELEQVSRVHAFESIASWNDQDLAVTGGDVPEAVNAFYGIGSTFPMLGVPALLGRNLGPSDSPNGQEPQPVVELHYRFWQRHFNGDPGVIGKTLELDHRKYTIVGVTRPNFTWDWSADVYLPQEIRNPQGGGVVVKLRRGVSLAAADAELQPLLDRFAQEHPREYSPNYKADLRPLTWEVTRNMGGTLYLLLGAVGMLLVIGCSNVSILLLARNTARQQEFAVRSAVGAGRVRIVRQLLTESLLLAVTGTGLGIVLAYRLLALMVLWMPHHLFPADVSIRINVPVLAFSAGLALVTALLFGLLPALQMAKAEIGMVVQAATRRIAGTVRGRRVHGVLVAGQIALTLLLLTAAGAAIEGFVKLLRIPLGYDPHHVVAVGIPLHQNTYTTWQERVNYFEQLRAVIAALPDVLSASVAGNAIPPDSGWEMPFEFLGRPALSPDAQMARINLVDSGYFRTLQMPLIAGRIWSPEEVNHGAAMVLVNQTFVRRYGLSGDGFGQSLKIPGLASQSPNRFSAPGAGAWMQVIGVVGDAVNNGIAQPVEPAIFAPYSAQVWMGTQILVRTRGTPQAMVNSLRKQVAAVNPEQQTSGAISDLEKWITDEPVWGTGRLISALFGGFAMLALALSAVGLYSVVSYTVAQRTNEFGVRLALGAPRGHVLRLVLASTAASVGGGVLSGLVLTLALHAVLTRWVGVNLRDPAMLVTGAAVLAAVAAIASLVPARRAAQVDPMSALRAE
jgi:putative ABC transport system permease protein